MHNVQLEAVTPSVRVSQRVQLSIWPHTSYTMVACLLCCRWLGRIVLTVKAVILVPHELPCLAILIHHWLLQCLQYMHRSWCFRCWNNDSSSWMQRYLPENIKAFAKPTLNEWFCTTRFFSQGTCKKGIPICEQKTENSGSLVRVEGFGFSHIFQTHGP